MERDVELEAAICQRKLPSIVELLFFEVGGMPVPRYKTEGELWDYKETCPRSF